MDKIRISLWTCEFSDKNSLASRMQWCKTSSVKESEKVKRLITSWFTTHEQRVRLNFPGQTAASRCERFPTFREINSSPSSGCRWWLGSKRRQTLPENISLNSVAPQASRLMSLKTKLWFWHLPFLLLFLCTFCSFSSYSHLRNSKVRDWHYKPIYLPSLI
jgi:hypothetical protein